LCFVQLLGPSSDKVVGVFVRFFVRHGDSSLVRFGFDLVYISFNSLPRCDRWPHVWTWPALPQLPGSGRRPAGCLEPLRDAPPRVLQQRAADSLDRLLVQTGQRPHRSRSTLKGCAELTRFLLGRRLGERASSSD
jgi:hypothetical protein